MQMALTGDESLSLSLSLAFGWIWKVDNLVLASVAAEAREVLSKTKKNDAYTMCDQTIKNHSIIIYYNMIYKLLI